ncbi:DUF885 domain-containing protein [Sphingomonas nostoxanthinifaciens]|uniref:DUF885 domain-containing protein n=1 Tax=Sphingomonas nostoxanthinifaciens TaxID=2872652 RepID=UPI001CC1E73E|nr:DUF885 family protein [Sphingomonas nostoxanthinifaciens]UAK23449.1 DUF885 family protein [Sphingomonas nostoxanthinifaciens]
MRALMILPLALLASTALAAAPAPGSPDARLKALYDAEWTWRMQELGSDPEGPRGGGAHMPHVDPASQARRYAYWQTALKQLDAIPLAQLSPEERINAEVFRAALEGFVTEQKYKEYEDPFGFWTWIAPRQGFGTVAQYRAYLGRVAEMPRYVDEQIANLKAGEKRGFTKPRVSLGDRWKTVVPLGSTDLANNPLYAPFALMPSSIPAADAPALKAEGGKAVADAAAAFAKLAAYLRDDYIPHARVATAAEALPDGKAYYAAKVRDYTTTELTPEAIHAIGVKEVARIDADMQATMKAAGWTGDFKGFLHFLKTDPQFTAKTPYELIAKSSYVANKINGQLKFTFGLLPRYRFTIVPTPANIAPFATGGNGGLDSCLMNTYDLPARPLYTIPPLTAHECVPGHSFQAALALEGPNRPAIRKSTYFSGYGEGWALYMEWLGTKMGIYETPYDEFGRETYEMWRAARLVVDTGLHHMGWTRDQALDFLKAHTALSDHEITIEVDRYINDPGQALAYKLGEMLIRRERAKAEATLGAKFDQRWFHDTILGLGAVPLDTLERVLDQWIADGGPEPAATRDALSKGE